MVKISAKLNNCHGLEFRSEAFNMGSLFAFKDFFFLEDVETGNFSRERTTPSLTYKCKKFIHPTSVY